MKRSIKFGLIILSVLIALSIGVTFGQKDTEAKVSAIGAVNTNEVADGSNTAANDAADDAKENEAVDKNETSEDAVIISSVYYGKTNQWVEIRNNETSTPDLTGWKLEVQNNTVFTFPKFALGANAKVIVHSGIGKDSSANLYANGALLSSADNEVSLIDASGNVVSDSEETKETSDSSGDE